MNKRDSERGIKMQAEIRIYTQRSGFLNTHTKSSTTPHHQNAGLVQKWGEKGKGNQRPILLGPSWHNHDKCDLEADRRGADKLIASHVGPRIVHDRSNWWPEKASAGCLI
jgi:hypothetical protein